MACGHSKYTEGCPDCATTLVRDGSALVTVAGEAAAREGTPGAEVVQGPPARGTQVGRYVLLDQVGAGGMGYVFAAYDPELNRKVAIKLLRLEVQDEKKATSGQTRLLREAQAMAQLSDPHVVPIHDVGTFRDGIFLAMEYVEGQTLADWIRSGGHDWRQMLGVLRDAGSGLAAAHRAGLVHRDFKPANVLIGADGRAQVADFGLARAENAFPPSQAVTRELRASQAHEAPQVPEAVASQKTPMPVSGPLSTPLTLAGTMMGTPGYMPPEQYSGGQVTAQTDQFAFCVSLYESLYGVRPFKGADVHAIAQTMHAGDVTPPPKDTRVPSWLWRVLQRGLSPDPTARYASMEALLAELSKDPAAQRRRWLAAGASALLVVAALAGARVYVVRQNRLCQGAADKLAGVWDSNASEEARKALEATKLPYVPATWEKVKARLDAYAATWAASYTDSCEATRRRGEQSEQVMDLRMQCLDEGRRELAALTSLLAHADAKVAQNAVTAVDGLPELSRCADVAALREPVPLPADPAARAKIAAAQERYANANTLFAAGKYKDSLKIARTLLPDADALGYAPFSAKAYKLVADLDFGLEDKVSPEALADYERAFREAQAAHLDGTATRTLLSLALSEVQDRAHPEEAHLLAELAHGTFSRMHDSGAAESGWHETLATIAHREGKTDESIAQFRRAIELSEKFRTPLKTAELQTELAWSLVDKGALEDADAALKKALALREKELGGDHPDVITSLNGLARETGLSGHFDEALGYVRRALAMTERIYGGQSARYCMLKNNLGATLLNMGGHEEEALREVKEAYALCIKALGETNPQLPMVHTLLAGALREAGHPKEALEAHQQAKAEFDRVHSTQPAMYCLPVQGIAEDYLALHKPRPALEQAKLAMQCMTAGKVEGIGLSSALEALGHAQLDNGDFAGATATLTKVVEMRTTEKADPADVAVGKFLLAQARWKADKVSARKLAEDAQHVFESRGLKTKVHEIEAWRVAHR